MVTERNFVSRTVCYRIFCCH